MSPSSLVEAARRALPDLTAGEILILLTAWLRMHVDGEEPAAVIRWARRTMGLMPGEEEVATLRAGGASVRQIAAETGLSKSKVARLLSQKAA